MALKKVMKFLKKWFEKSFFSSPDLIFPFKIRNLQKLHNAWGTRTNQAHEALRLLSWPKLLARRKLPVLSAASSCGPIARRTTSRILRSSSSSSWQEDCQDLHHRVQQCLRHDQVLTSPKQFQLVSLLQCKKNISSSTHLVYFVLYLKWRSSFHKKQISLSIFWFLNGSDYFFKR